MKKKKQVAKLRIMEESSRKLILVEEDYYDNQTVDKSAEYLVKRLRRKLSSELVNLLIEQMLGFNEWMQQEFDELLIERNRYGAVWLHFAVSPKDNRNKVNFINA